MFQARKKGEQAIYILESFNPTLMCLNKVYTQQIYVISASEPQIFRQVKVWSTPEVCPVETSNQVPVSIQLLIWG